MKGDLVVGIERRRAWRTQHTLKGVQITHMQFSILKIRRKTQFRCSSYHICRLCKQTDETTALTFHVMQRDVPIYERSDLSEGNRLQAKFL
jgi:hypothetical protein